MRWIGLGGMASAAVLAGALPATAAARDRQLQGSAAVTGSISVTWHGDPARGCAAAGLCGYRGSLTLRPGPTGDVELDLVRGRLAFGFLALDAHDPTPVRVTREPAGGGEPGGCVDLVGAPEADLQLVPSGHGRARVQFESAGLSSGRCAGPALAKALALVPSRTVSIARLLSGGAPIDMSGQSGYASGHFSGRVVSTLRMRVGRARAVRNEPIPPGLLPPPSRRPRRPAVRVARVDVRYGVASMVGSVSTAFDGLPEPGCLPFDACDASGTATWAAIAHSGVVEVSGVARVPRSAHGVRDALAALRSGRGVLVVEGLMPHAKGTTTAEVTRPGAESCRDAVPVRAPDFALTFATRRFPLLLGGDQALGRGDVVRTGCPGPTQLDAFGRGSLASGSLPIAALGRRRVELTLTRGGRFSGGGYAGARTGRFTVELRRERLTVSYRHALVEP
jgi:hypothetical protein